MACKTGKIITALFLGITILTAFADGAAFNTAAQFALPEQDPNCPPGPFSPVAQEGILSVLVRVAGNADLPEVKRLVTRCLGAEVDALGPNGNNALHEAAFRATPEMVVYLIEAGADPNRRNVDGWAPIHLAAKSNAMAVIKALITNGADSTMKTRAGKGTPGKTAAEIAEESGREDVKTFIEQEQRRWIAEKEACLDSLLKDIPDKEAEEIFRADDLWGKFFGLYVSLREKCELTRAWRSGFQQFALKRFAVHHKSSLTEDRKAYLEKFVFGGSF